MNSSTAYLKTGLNLFLSIFSLELRRKAKSKPPQISDLLIQDDQKDLILVFQMGKVASKTVKASLSSRGYFVLDCHNLTDETFAEAELFFSDDYAPPDYVRHELNMTSEFKFIRFMLFNYNGNFLSRLKIITGVREPISYLVSAYFENYENFFSYYVERKYGSLTFNNIKRHFLGCLDTYMEVVQQERDINDVNFKQVCRNNKEADLRNFLFLCRWPLIWFDREMKQIFGFDIYSNKFDKTTYHNIYETDEIPILVIRQEDFGKVAEKQIAEFINDPRFRIINRNAAKDKSYSELYQSFCSSITIPKEFIDYQYSSQYAKYFYTNDELKRFTDQWSGNRS